MNELKLTELAPYLPYGVECIVDPNYAQIRTKIWRLDAQEGDANIFSFFSKGEFYYRTLKSVKPILRPLSDLTRVIEHDEEKFTPIDRLEYKYGYLGFNTKTPIIDQAGYHAIQTLLSWHMDLFSLIPRNLAVDYNTLNQNT